MSYNIQLNIDDNNDIDEKDIFYEGYYLKPYLGEDREECSICMDNDIVNYNKWVKLGCSHFFHRNCILLWINERPTCPICRENVYQSYRAYIEKPKSNLGKLSIILCSGISTLIFIIILFFQKK